MCLFVFPVKEFDKIPMFMKKAPEDLDPMEHPEVACIQSMLYDENQSPEGTRKIIKANLTLNLKLQHCRQLSDSFLRENVMSQKSYLSMAGFLCFIYKAGKMI